MNGVVVAAPSMRRIFLILYFIVLRLFTFIPPEFESHQTHLLSASRNLVSTVQ